MPCDVPGACLGTKQTLLDLQAAFVGLNASDVPRRQDENASDVQAWVGESECLEGHTGFLCGECVANAYVLTVYNFIVLKMLHNEN